MTTSSTSGASPPAHIDHASGTRLTVLWSNTRDSLWFVPALCTVAAVTLALVLVHVDASWSFIHVRARWLFQGGADGARGVLTAIAGSLITVTGVVFSITIVALQLASSQFTPRVLHGFMADRANQMVLGVLIGTFTYTVMVLRTVTTGSGSEPAFVPEIAVTTAIGLVLISIAALIYYINHAARSVQASVILTRETTHALRRVDELFPEDIGKPDMSAPGARVPTGPPASIVARRSGYLLAVHAHALFALAETHSLTIRMECLVGCFILPGEPMASVWPPEVVDDAVVNAVLDAFVLGEERTPEQDVELGIIGISDIALRALSPAINDPTTAMLCIDRLAQIIARLGTLPEPLPVRSSKSGELRFIARMTSFERALGLAFDQIRYFGGGNPAIIKKLLDVLNRLSALIPQHRQALSTQMEATLSHARESIPSRDDRVAVERIANAMEGLRANSAEISPRVVNPAPEQRRGA